MLVVGLILVFAPLRLLTLGSRPPESSMHGALPEVQGAGADAAIPDGAPVPSPPAAIQPEAEMLTSDAGVGPPIATVDAAEEEEEEVVEAVDAAAAQPGMDA